MLKKTILSTSLVITTVLLAACGSGSKSSSGAKQDIELSQEITAVSVLGTTNDATTVIANSATDSNDSPTGFEILLPLDGEVLSADPGDGSTVSEIINLQVTNDLEAVKTVNIEVVINPI